MKRLALSASALAFAALLSAGCSKTDSGSTASGNNNSSTTAAASGGGGGGGATKLDPAKCGDYAQTWGTLTASIATGPLDDATQKKIADIKAAVPSDVAKNIETVENGIKGKSTVDAAMFIGQGDGQKAYQAVTTWLTTSCTAGAAAAAGK